MKNTLTLEWETTKQDDEHFTHDATCEEKTFRIFERWDKHDEVWVYVLVLWTDDVEDSVEDEVYADLDEAMGDAEAWNTMPVVYDRDDGWHLDGWPE